MLKLRGPDHRQGPLQGRGTSRRGHLKGCHISSECRAHLEPTVITPRLVPSGQNGWVWGPRYGSRSGSDHHQSRRPAWAARAPSPETFGSVCFESLALGVKCFYQGTQKGSKLKTAVPS